MTIQPNERIFTLFLFLENYPLMLFMCARSFTLHTVFVLTFFFCKMVVCCSSEMHASCDSLDQFIENENPYDEVPFETSFSPRIHQVATKVILKHSIYTIQYIYIILLLLF